MTIPKLTNDQWHDIRIAALYGLMVLVFTLKACHGDAVYSQKPYDCNARPITVVGSIEMGVHRGMITEAFKVGIWQNNKPNGFTLFGGYQIGVTTFNGKGEQTSQIQTLFGELGYKMRISKPFIIHGYGGYNLAGKYVGVTGYVQIQEDLMLGAYYKQGIIGGALLFAF